LCVPPPSPLFPYTTLFLSNVIRQIFSSFGIVFFSIYYEVRRAQLFSNAIDTQEATLQALNEAFMIAGIFILVMIPVSFIMKAPRSEEHTSELQSRFDLVCR